MGNPPPPFPPPPPSGPPQGFGQPAAVAPSWQGNTTLVPGPPPSGKRKLPLIIGAVVIVVAIVVVAVLAFGGGGSSGNKAVSSQMAHEGLQVVLDSSTFDAGGFDDLRVCPLGDLDELYTAVATVIELDPAVTNGIDDKSARQEGDLPGFVSCQRYAKDATKVVAGPDSVFFQAVLDPPRDYQRYITDFVGDASKVTFDDSVSYRSGEVVMFCAKETGDNGFTGCDADWVDKTNKIALNVFLGGRDATSEDAFAALKVVLDRMAENLSGLARNGS